MNVKVLAAAVSCALISSASAVYAANGNEGASSSQKAASSQVTAEQRAMLAEKLRLVEQIVRSVEPDMQARQLGAEPRRWMLESLYSMPLAQVRLMGGHGSFDALSKAIATAAKPAAKLGQLSSELVYFPINPCRFIDTRNVGGPIVGSRQFDLDTNGGTYGGSAACSPVSNAGLSTSGNAAAIALNVTIVSPTAAPGFLGARPVGTTNTTSLVNWYQSGPTVQASNAGVVGVDQDGAVANEIEFFGSPTQIIVDVFGLFASSTATALECVQTDSSTVAVANNGSDFVNPPACTTGYTPTGYTCQNDDATFSTYVVRTALGGPTCRFRNFSGGVVNISAHSICCRVPGR